MSALCDAVLSPENIRLAWRLLRNDRAPWAPNVDHQDLHKNLPYHLLRLVNELSAGTYRPEAYRQWAVAKGDGGRRVLSAQYLRDKLAQRLVLQVLEPLGERIFHHDSFGYRPGRGVPHALARVRERLSTGLVWLVDADIEKFFDRVPHRPLLRVVKRTFANRWLQHLVEAWLDVGPHPASLLQARRGLLQGAVISPFLCNLYLHNFDQAMAKANITFVRYADDFLLMTPSVENARRAHTAAQSALARIDLALNAKKTRVSLAGPEVIFLGERVVRPPCVTNSLDPQHLLGKSN